MGASTREKGVLKLVYPGRHVEIYNEPITAAEVMRKNPRHCVARPDVFKYPWIVVRPESVLSLERVFYIVPLHTIHCLLKARGYYKQPPLPPPQSRSPKSHDRRRKSLAGMTPKHQSHKQPLRRPSLCTPWSGVVNSEEENSDESQSQQSYVVISNNRITYESPIDSKEYNCKRSSAIAALPKNDNRNTKIKCSQQVNGLKSCLRKQDSVRKSYNLRVTFASTLKCRVISPPTEPLGFFIC